MKKKISKSLYWSPRIITILFIAFLALFSLDVFENSSSLTEIIIGLLMHNIPAFILLAILLISWKYEFIGAIGFFLAGILYVGIMIYNSFTEAKFYQISYSFIIAGPAFLISWLWWMNWKRKK